MVFETVRYVVADILFGDFSIVPLKGVCSIFSLRWRSSVLVR